MPEYYEAAIRVFKHYGLSVIEPDQEFRHLSVRVDETHYSDPAHFHRRHNITGLIGRMTAKRLDTAAIPEAHTHLVSSGTLELIELPLNSTFKNSLTCPPIVPHS